MDLVRVGREEGGDEEKSFFLTLTAWIDHNHHSGLLCRFLLPPPAPKRIGNPHSVSEGTSLIA